MRQVTRKGLITMAAAGGAIALGGGYAHAGAEATGGASHSPGVASGNSVQVPVSVPVNVCGNSVNAVALLNPTFGNSCANVSGGGSPGGAQTGGGDTAGPQPGGSPSGPQTGAQTGGGSQANGGAHHSPGVGSGNNVQAPVDVPVNACGNSVTLGGLLNPTFGNDCANASTPTPPGEPAQPGEPAPPAPPTKPGEPTPVTPEPPTTRPSTPGDPGTHGRTTTNAHKANSSRAQIAEQPKGEQQLAQTGADSLGLIIPVGAGMMLAGAVLYRRARVHA
ncbi:chaplin family protein [Streptomyces sp. NPDC020141]|uniref:chaplin n=1 Tax=Streptomyces sp. NPDC020141 TaxID=3365065 RepID=UPI0037AC150F